MTAPNPDFDSLTIAQAALSYARIGLRVLPVARETKRPLPPHGAHDASCDEATIRAWWKRWPQANVGIALHGLVVVDIDPRNGAPADRDEIAAMLGPWPETAEGITGGGGRHLYFRARDGLQPPGSLAPGIDVKSGPGSYVVAPPSVHANGRRYAWDGLADPLEALRDLPLAPDWVYRRAAGPRYAAPEDDGAPIPEGQRNETLFRLGCALRRRGLSRAGIEAALLAENAQRCQPPLPEDEVRRIAESCARYRAGAIGGPKPDEDGQQAKAPAGGIDAARITSPAEALAILNALGIWKTIRWAEWKRRGDTLIGTTEAGEEVRISARRLLIFDHCAGEIMAATGVSILRPRKGMIRTVWGQVAELIHKAATADVVETAPPEEELREDLLRCWRLAGEPAPENNEELYRVLSELRGYTRQPHEATAPPAVFKWGLCWHVHLGVFRLWLSTPSAAARFTSIDQLQAHAALLGFRPHHLQLQAQVAGDRLRMRTWSAPLDVMDEA
jgi:hypothetical protein